MKKIFSLALILFSSLVFSLQVDGQSRLKILQLINYPDTVTQDSTIHGIQMVIENVGTNNFFGEINAYLYSQSIGFTGVDTLRDDPFHHNWFLLPGETDTIPANPNYAFRTIHYAAGDNIIVVWPYSSAINFDTTITNVFFVATVGIPELNETSISAYPNPVSQILSLNYQDENKVEQVRIFDLTGREIFNEKKAVKTIMLSGFDDGLYYLELIEKDQRHVVKKILITHN